MVELLALEGVNLSLSSLTDLYLRYLTIARNRKNAEPLVPPPKNPAARTYDLHHGRFVFKNDTTWRCIVSYVYRVMSC